MPVLLICRVRVQDKMPLAGMGSFPSLVKWISDSFTSFTFLQSKSLARTILSCFDNKGFASIVLSQAASLLCIHLKENQLWCISVRVQFKDREGLDPTTSWKRGDCATAVLHSLLQQCSCFQWMLYRPSSVRIYGCLALLSNFSRPAENIFCENITENNFQQTFFF